MRRNSERDRFCLKRLLSRETASITRREREKSSRHTRYQRVLSVSLEESPSEINARVVLLVRLNKRAARVGLGSVLLL